LKTSEDALIRRAKALDTGALAEIYERYFDGIYRYVYARVSHQADAEDLTEQVFLKMVDSIGNYRLRGIAFSSWLYRIAHNLLVDRYRRTDRAPVELRGHVVDRSPQSDPELALQSATESRRLLEAIGRLTPDQRQLISLRFVENLEVEQVARIMKRRPGAIHSMQHRALASLNRLMQESESEQLEIQRAQA
jgi:RNA polymerase sigma-70 factor (ECF subfamily)